MTQPSASVHKKRTKYNVQEARTAALFLLPAIAVLLFFSYYPAFEAVKGSFFRWDGMNTAEFVGLRNYKQLFANPIFWTSIKNVFEWSLGSVIVALCAPLIGALMIFHLRSKKQQYWYRALFVIPMVIPFVVVIQIWSFIYEPTVGLLNTLLRTLGLDGAIRNWLGETQLVIPSLIFIGFPWISGMNMLIYYAGLQNVPQDVLEYAEIDGCTAMQKVLHIELPLITGQVRLLLMLAIVNTLQNITVPLLLTSGGPGYDSYVPGLLMYYQAFRSTKFGMAYTTATVMFVIILVLTLISAKLKKKDTLDREVKA
ncbi:MAG: sugar ABC transporter permease [Clostridia bacterium]